MKKIQVEWVRDFSLKKKGRRLVKVRKRGIESLRTRDSHKELVNVGKHQ